MQILTPWTVALQVVGAIEFMKGYTLTVDSDNTTMSELAVKLCSDIKEDHVLCAFIVDDQDKSHTSFGWGYPSVVCRYGLKYVSAQKKKPSIAEVAEVM